jgi:hypothetical protein
MSEPRTRFEAAMDKRHALMESEAAGEVADSHSMRLAIMARVRGGEITLAQAQAELMEIQASAVRIGKKTRGQAFNEG